MLKKINRQLSSHKLIVRNGQAKVDASLTESPFNPKGATTYEVAEDRSDNTRSQDHLEQETTYHKLQEVAQPNACLLYTSPSPRDRG